ncbi:MAG: hypothetical protein ACI8U3_000909 [Brevundimonas sp.]|jgi:hypothetical protein|uniref:hypothetical protein n=1 Tax=Brevundimonas sp. TaxID=1871086 RepID=UPI0039E408CF
MRSWILAAALAFTAAGCAASPSATDQQMAESFAALIGGGQVSGAALEERALEASRHPLGSLENPIRVNMPEGQRAYLDSLRCADGTAPAYRRTGSFGPGIYGSIIDGYEVRCAGAEPATLIMDMYHPRHVETGTPPGFTRP